MTSNKTNNNDSDKFKNYCNVLKFNFYRYLTRENWKEKNRNPNFTNTILLFILPLPQTMMLPLLSPVRTSPFWLNATQVTYLGFSLLSKIPIRLYSIPPLSRDQKDRCPFPQDTIWFRSSGCHSAHTTVSTEHYNWPSSFIEWTGSGFAHSRIIRVCVSL